jgi:hypothetical protein
VNSRNPSEGWRLFVGGEQLLPFPFFSLGLLVEVVAFAPFSGDAVLTVLFAGLAAVN